MSQPGYSNAVGYISEQFVTLYFDVGLDAGNPPPPNAFSVQLNGSGTTVTGVTVDGAAKTVTLSLSTPLIPATSSNSPTPTPRAATTRAPFRA
ncbi:SwmB domain-containing protein [Phenylobacterium sp. NIBR 498073]|uniref:SwmB domain-containing protein n=1 Tax=Phenylobacterium sp. NIBR 498073 TaxID=3015177 RepID=UPI0022B4A401|nr:SwmB domain-containing protein [Phenylobacterium sp. NIBR 498073]WGU41932.1 SwmB domain-containing protein [Phenylobacterium sp. NIBR 498073]